MITKHADSHVDHNLTDEQLEFVLSQDPSKHGDGAVRVFTVTMPVALGLLPCNLYGPAEGDLPIEESEVEYQVRGDRKGKSRVLPKAMIRYGSTVTIVAGPHDGHEWVLFTSYGGSAAPREPFEFEDDDQSAEAVHSREYWAVHALALG